VGDQVRRRVLTRERRTRARRFGRSLVALCCVCLLLWIASVSIASTSVLEYAVLYNLVMPVMVVSVPLHWVWSPERAVSSASFEPGALLTNQQYDVSIVLVAPDSAKNADVGMVNIDLALGVGVNTGGRAAATSARSFMLRYENAVVGWVSAFGWLPASALGMAGYFGVDEQHVSVPLFERLVVPEGVDSATVTLSSPKLGQFGVYHATLVCHVQLTGWQKVLYQWFLTSAVLIIWSCCVFNCLCVYAIGGLLLLKLDVAGRVQTWIDEEEEEEEQDPILVDLGAEEEEAPAVDDSIGDAQEENLPQVDVLEWESHAFSEAEEGKDMGGDDRDENSLDAFVQEHLSPFKAGMRQRRETIG
jgi:hypothetical protein